MDSGGKERWPRFAVAEAKQARDFINAHGWIIFRDVFAAEEIETLRKKAGDAAQLAHDGDILSNPVFGGDGFILNRRILQIAETILQSRPSYFGDSSVSINGNILGFHKDNANRFDTTAPDWDLDYNLIRVGLYLQDHDKYSGGLSVRDQSHRSADHSFGEPISVPSRAGDVVVWRLTTTHSGEAVRLRIFGSTFVPIPIARIMRHVGPISRAIFRPRQYKDRIALFATFAGAGTHLETYLKYLKTRRYAVEGWRRSSYPNDQAKLASEAGLEFIDMRAEITKLNDAALHDEYVAPAR